MGYDDTDTTSTPAANMAGSRTPAAMIVASAMADPILVTSEAATLTYSGTKDTNDTGIPWSCPYLGGRLTLPPIRSRTFDKHQRIVFARLTALRPTARSSEHVPRFDAWKQAPNTPVTGGYSVR